MQNIEWQEVDMKDVGNRLRELRGIRTRVGVAKELKINPTRLANYEHGTRCPDNDMLNRLADYYKVSANYILYANG